MKALGFAAFSGMGKTTLLEQLIAALRARGQRVSTVKHAHRDVDIDIPGKDSWRPARRAPA
ncbi:MAG: molybdopterin-guanine dinucleotide biosynthesis protein MobB, partial [Comamonas sp.]|nr:molybdopterin-guanine dinucleotide biosynthesis protein MobB [Candidatus Comamonas equi]